MSGIYPWGREAFLIQQISWIGQTNMCVAFVGAGYVWNGNSNVGDRWFSQVTNVIGVPLPLVGKNVFGGGTPGVATTDNLTSGNIAAGSIITQLILFLNSGDPNSSHLIAHIDVTPTPTNGGTVTITWDTIGIFIL